jgi:hypothetical protein
MLVRLSDKLSTELKTFIGTILISELVHAVKKRPTADPNQFCVFVDEFQNFASYDDFSSLITGGRKYGIATTIAHQERFGQFADNKVILGATDGAGNKVIFQTSVRDGQELAAEFAREPPTRTQREECLTISRTPIWELLRGHDNPEVCDFVDKYVRPLKDRLEDITGEIETDRIMRQDLMDEAGLYRIEQQIEGTRRSYADTERMRSALYQAGRAGVAAKKRSESMVDLREEVTQLTYSSGIEQVSD